MQVYPNIDLPPDQLKWLKRGEDVIAERLTLKRDNRIEDVFGQ